MRRNTRAAAARRGAGRLIRGCSQNPLRKLRKVLASPAQLGRCRRHTTTEGSEAQNPLRKLRKSKPLQTRRKREGQTGKNDQAHQVPSLSRLPRRGGVAVAPLVFNA